MKTAIAIAVGLALALLSGCVGVSTGDVSRPDLAYRALGKVKVPVIPPQGLLYTSYHAPLSLEPTAFGPKKGRATSYQIGLPPLPFRGLATGIDLIAWGDASQRRAALNGRIEEVGHADYEMRVFLFIYRIFTTEVYGN